MSYFRRKNAPRPNSATPSPKVAAVEGSGTALIGGPAKNAKCCCVGRSSTLLELIDVYTCPPPFVEYSANAPSGVKLAVSPAEPAGTANKE
jgi:hypothetical protein